MISAPFLAHAYGRNRYSAAFSNLSRTFVRFAIALLVGLSCAAQATAGTSVFTTQVPSGPRTLTDKPKEFGTAFRAAKDGQVTAIRYWKASGDLSTHTGNLWDGAGHLLASVVFRSESAGGWQRQALSTPVRIAANSTYVVSVGATKFYATTPEGLLRSVSNGDLSTLPGPANGLFGTLGQFPRQSYLAANYFRDVEFVADPPPPSTISKVSGDGQGGVTGTRLASPLTVRVLDGRAAPKSGLRVAFSTTAGGGRLSVTSALTDAGGYASTMLTLGAARGTNVVRATATGIGFVDFTAMAFSASQLAPASLSKTSGDAQTGIVRTALATPLAVTVRDGRGLPMSGTTVTFAVTGGGGSVSVGSAATNSAGVASSILTLGSVAGANSVRATVAGVGSVDFTETAIPAPTIAKSSGDAQTGVVGTVLPSPLTVIVRDGLNAPVAGAGVTFTVTAGGGAVSAVTTATNAAGQASTALTLGASAGANAVRATVAGIGMVDFTATAIPAPTVSKSSGDAQTGIVGTTLPAPFSVIVRNGLNAAVSGATVTFTVTTGGGTVSTATTTTNAAGLASTTLTLGAVVGRNVVHASVAGIGSVDFSATAVAPPTVAKLSGDGQSAAVGKALASPFVVVVRDGLSAPMPGIVVTFAVTSGGGTLSTGSATTDAAGQAATTLTLGSSTGANTVHATAAGIGSLDFTATATVPPPGHVVLSSTAGGIGTYQQPLVYTARLYDADGNPLATDGIPVRFSVSGGGTMFVPDSVVATSAGIATATVVPTATGSFVLTASAPGMHDASTTLVISLPVTETLFGTQSPVSANLSDGTTYELGTKFSALHDGAIEAIRFWKDAGETGVHVGHVWSAAGVELARVTFAGETASGWQTQALAAPLAVSAGNTYVVTANVNTSYVATAGGLAASIGNGDIATVADGANGVFGPVAAFPTRSFNNSNYFRDVVFTPGPLPYPTLLVALSGAGQSAPPGTTLSKPLTVQVRDANGTPLPGRTVAFSVLSGGGRVGTSTAVTDLNGEASTIAALGAIGINTFHAAVGGVGAVDFSEMADPAGAVALSLAPASASTVPGAAVAFTATLVDASGYVVTGASTPVAFAASGVAGTLSAAGVAPSDGVAFATFRPSGAGTATIAVSAPGLRGATANLAVVAGIDAQTILTTQTPSLPDATDGTNYELGMKFQSRRPGQITAIDYWKAPSESGAHTGHIWDATGVLLASVPFSGETSSGWQRQALDVPLPIDAATTYVVSVNANAYFSVTPAGMATSISNGDLFSLADGSNDVYGAYGTFPASSYQAANYFRDVTFVADQVPQLSKVSGDLQQGSAGAALAQPLVVQAIGADGKPLAGATITFAVASGGGRVSPSTAVSDSSGYARTMLTMGSVAARNSVTASLAWAGQVTFSAVVPNAVYLENLKPGAPGALAALTQHYTSTGIAGYADALSVDKGQPLALRVSMPEAGGTYTVDTYRLGWYGGAGARLVATSGPQAGTAQPPCQVTDPATHLIECKWTPSITVETGPDWTSGLYVARLTNNVSGLMHPVFFIVRDDAGHADILFQSSRTTSIAYGSYGTPTEGHSLYAYNSTGGIPAQKVSLDRPSSEMSEFSNLLNFEYPMARWLESQGYDVSYTTNLDIHTGGVAAIDSHKLFLSVGHDEYWSLEMRDAVEQARDSGVNLGFFSGNAAYWRVRFEPSSDGVPNRVMVCYKDPANTPDPVAPTYRWRGPENNRPENALIGVMYIGDNSVLHGGFDYVVKNAADPLYANTGLADGMALSALVGYEWDGIVDNGHTPRGLVPLSASPVIATTIATVESGEQEVDDQVAQIASAAYYKTAGGATVFAMGSIQWMWGLDSYGVSPPRVDPRAQQFAVNLLANGGARPLSPAQGVIVP